MHRESPEAVRGLLLLLAAQILQPFSYGDLVTLLFKQSVPEGPRHLVQKRRALWRAVLPMVDTAPGLGPVTSHSVILFSGLCRCPIEHPWLPDSLSEHWLEPVSGEGLIMQAGWGDGVTKWPCCPSFETLCKCCSILTSHSPDNKKLLAYWTVFLFVCVCVLGLVFFFF